MNERRDSERQQTVINLIRNQATGIGDVYSLSFAVVFFLSVAANENTHLLERGFLTAVLLIE